MSSIERYIIKLKRCRVEYPHLITRGSFEGKENEKYDSFFFIPKDSKNKNSNIMKISRAYANLLKDNDLSLDYANTFEHKLIVDCEFNALKFHQYEKTPFYQMKGKNTNRPVIYGKDKNPLSKDHIDSLVTEKKEFITSGDWVNAVLHLFFYEYGNNKGITAILHSVQLVERGESLLSVPFSDQQLGDMYTEIENEPFVEIEENNKSNNEKKELDFLVASSEETTNHMDAFLD